MILIKRGSKAPDDVVLVIEKDGADSETYTKDSPEGRAIEADRAQTIIRHQDARRRDRVKNNQASFTLASQINDLVRVTELLEIGIATALSIEEKTELAEIRTRQAVIKTIIRNG